MHVHVCMLSMYEQEPLAGCPWHICCLPALPACSAPHCSPACLSAVRLQYLGWLLDYQGSDTGAAANLNRNRPNTTDAGLEAAVGALMREDGVLYSAALRRLQEQRAAMQAATVSSAVPAVKSGGGSDSSSSEVSGSEGRIGGGDSTSKDPDS